MNELKTSHNELQLCSLMEQIQQELKGLHAENIELTEQLTSFYQNLCHLRQSFSIATAAADFQSNLNLITTSNDVDNSSLQAYVTKPRSDSEPNILAHRQRIITIIEDLQ